MNKDEILKAMELRFMEDYITAHREFQSEAVGQTFEPVLRSLVRKLFLFYHDNPYYYVFFLIQMLKFPFIKRPDVHDLMKEQIQLFGNFFKETLRYETDRESNSRLHYFYVSTTFWFSPYFIDGCRGKAKTPKLSAAEIDAAVEETCRLCLGGVMKDKNRIPVAFENIEKSAAVLPEDSLPRDRILSAIEEVLTEEGVEDTTIDKIAAKVGMSKSSLYFFFKNKHEMLSKMVEREQEHLRKLVRERLDGLSNLPERAYGFMVAMATYAMNNPALLTAFGWLRSQNIDFGVKHPGRDYAEEFFFFIREAEKEGLLVLSGERALQAGGLLHVLSMHAIIAMQRIGKSRDEIVATVRNFHAYYLYGLLATGEGSAADKPQKESL